MVIENNAYFSAEQICESGQCFRFERLDGGRYQVTAFDRLLVFSQREDELFFECSPQEYGEVWKQYFDMDTDYGRFVEAAGRQEGYLHRASLFGKGIRILRQDLWETMISFIISQQNHIKRIKKCIETLCREYGVKECAAGRDYYTFPAPQALAEATEEELRACGLGYRSRYIRAAAESVAAGRTDLDALRKMDYRQARAELMKLSGVGGKVADCICLFALHHLEAFPVDTHIRKVLDCFYPEGFPYEAYPGYAGVLQQYMFYYDLRGTENGSVII